MNDKNEHQPEEAEEEKPASLGEKIAVGIFLLVMGSAICGLLYILAMTWFVPKYKIVEYNGQYAVKERFGEIMEPHQSCEEARAEIDKLLDAKGEQSAEMEAWIKEYRAKKDARMKLPWKPITCEPMPRQ